VCEIYTGKNGFVEVSLKFS